MSDCKSPDGTILRAGPPLKKFRTLNVFKHCLVNENAPPDNTYDEIPFMAKELPDQVKIKSFQLLSGMFVIPYDRPRTVLVSEEFFPGKKSVRCRVQRRGNLPFDKRSRRQARIVHTYLTEAAPVIAAGEYSIDDDMKTVTIKNDSGHYHPPPETLEYAKCVFEMKGYDVIRDPVPAPPGESLFVKNSLPLANWLKKPYGEWYEGGQRKRKTRKRKSKH